LRGSGIDPAFEEGLELQVQRRAAECLVDELIEGERRQMTFVKNRRVA
jgi:hypothetical protein